MAGAPPPAGPPWDPEALSADPDAWVARLAEAERRSRSGVLASPPDRSRRVAIMIGGAAAVIVVLGVLMLLVTWVAG